MAEDSQPTPTIDPGYDAAETRRAAARAGDYRWPGYLLLAWIAATLVGVYAGRTSGDYDLRHLSDGPTNGWLPLFSSILALAVFDRFRRGTWPAVATIVVVSLGALGRVVSSQAVPNFSYKWGWWVALGGATVLLAATVLAAGFRVAARRVLLGGHHRARRRERHGDRAPPARVANQDPQSRPASRPTRGRHRAGRANRRVGADPHRPEHHADLADLPGLPRRSRLAGHRPHE